MQGSKIPIGLFWKIFFFSKTVEKDWEALSSTAFNCSTQYMDKKDNRMEPYKTTETRKIVQGMKWIRRREEEISMKEVGMTGKNGETIEGWKSAIPVDAL